MKLSSGPPPPLPSRSAFARFRFPAEAIVLAVCWYLRYGLSYRDVEELLAERGVQVDHVTVHRWMQRFTPLLADVRGPAGTRPVTGGSPTRPTSKSMASGAMCTEPSTSTAKSSTCSCRNVALVRRRRTGRTGGRSASSPDATRCEVDPEAGHGSDVLMQNHLPAPGPIAKSSTRYSQCKLPGRRRFSLGQSAQTIR